MTHDELTSLSPGTVVTVVLPDSVRRKMPTTVPNDVADLYLDAEPFQPLGNRSTPSNSTFVVVEPVVIIAGDAAKLFLAVSDTIVPDVHGYSVKVFVTETGAVGWISFGEHSPLHKGLQRVTLGGTVL